MTQKEILESLKNRQTQTTQFGRSDLSEVIKAMESIAVSMETLSGTAVQRVQTAEEEAERHIEALERKLQKWDQHIGQRLQQTTDAIALLQATMTEASLIAARWRWRTWGWVAATTAGLTVTLLLLGVLLRWQGVQTFLMRVLLTVN